VDLMNHASGGAVGVSWCWDQEARAMVATANRAHAAGEELLDSYGLRSNLLLYRTYGFTQGPEQEPSWTCIVHPQCVHSIYEDFLLEEHLGLQIMLESTRMDPSLCTALNAAGARAAEFLRLICARSLIAYEADTGLQPALEALRIARAEAPTSCAWWSRLGPEEMHLVAEEGTRIKMCEYLCLVAHLEAVDIAGGGAVEEQCLAGAVALRKVICDALLCLQEGGNFTLASVPLTEAA